MEWCSCSLVPVMENSSARFSLAVDRSAHDFKTGEGGGWDLRAFWIVPAVFAIGSYPVDDGDLLGLMMGYCCLRTKRRLGACIVAHGVTNLLLEHTCCGRQRLVFW